MTTATTAHLTLLRVALDALSMLGDDRPDRKRLRHTLRVLDPALSGEAFAPYGFVGTTGMPAPAWIGRATPEREQTMRAGERAERDASALVSLGGAVPGVSERLLRERTFRRILRREPLFPPPTRSSLYAVDGLWWVWDRLLEDGRWARIRCRGTPTFPPGDGDAWFDAPMSDLTRTLGRPARRCVIGPVWRDAQEDVRGLHATLETPDAPPVRRLAIERAHAEDVDTDFMLVPIAVPG